MGHKEKWIALKDYIEKVVMWGQQQVDQISMKDQNKLTAYKHILGYMNWLDDTEKTIRASDEKQMNEIIDEIVAEIVAEKFDDLNK